MSRTKATDQSASNALVSAAVIVGGLYFGREILMPFALAILLSFLLAPPANFLEKCKVGRIPSVILVVSLAVCTFGILAFVLANQIYDLAYKLPNYKENILAKAETFRGDGNGVVDRATRAIEEMSEKLYNPTAESKPAVPAEPVVTKPDTATQPVPVEVVETLSGPKIVQGVIAPLVSPLAAAGMVIIFVIFMLLEREDLRNRFIHLVGSKQLNVTTQALDDAAEKVSRYLLMQLIINTAYGLVICIGLLLIGLPNAFLWGTLTAVLRFVPYVGPWIAAVMPIAIALAVFEGWWEPSLILVLFAVNELISNNVMEPWIYGSTTGISTIGILASAVFWTWIWGPVGLIMATPLTVCLTVVAKYVPQLAFLNTMLSDEDVLPAHTRFYQRLLALDPEEATEVAEEFLASSSLEQLYETVLLPALSLAEQDRHRGELDDEQQRLVHEATREIAEDAGRRAVHAATGQTASADAVPTRAPAALLGPKVICLPARDEADEIAGLMLVQLLEQRGVSAKVISTKVLTSEMIEAVSEEASAIVCVSALPPFAGLHARYLCKRLRPRFPSMKLVVGLWQNGGVTKKAQERLDAAGINKLVTTLSDAAGELERLSQNAAAQPPSAAAG